MRVLVNYVYKNDKGKKVGALHELDYSMPDRIEDEVVKELLRYDIKEKTGRKVKDFAMFIRMPDHIK